MALSQNSRASGTSSTGDIAFLNFLAEFIDRRLEGNFWQTNFVAEKNALRRVCVFGALLLMGMNYHILGRHIAPLLMFVLAVQLLMLAAALSVSLVAVSAVSARRAVTFFLVQFSLSNYAITHMQLTDRELFSTPELGAAASQLTTSLMVAIVFFVPLVSFKFATVCSLMIAIMPPIRMAQYNSNLTTDTSSDAQIWHFWAPAFFVFSAILSHHLHTYRRSMYFAMRRLRAENIQIQIATQSPLGALKSMVSDLSGRPTGRVDPIDDDEDALGSQPWLVVPSSLQWGTLLGQGAFGSVFRGRWRGCDVAIKVVKESLGSSQEHKTEAHLDIAREIALLATLRHPNIVLFMGLLMESQRMALVTEFVEGGTLFSLIHDPPIGAVSPRPIPLAACLSVARQIAAGMAYLSGCDPPILHRDLKPENVLIGRPLQAKISDFGLSGASVGRNKRGYLIGTPLYFAPELCQDGAPEFSPATDVWAFAVMVNEIFSGQLPYSTALQGGPLHCLLVGIARGQRPEMSDRIPEGLMSLLSVCLSDDPELRPSFEQILDTIMAMDTGPQSSLDYSMFDTEQDGAGPTGHIALCLVEACDMGELWTTRPAQARTIAHVLAEVARGVGNDLFTARTCYEVSSEAGCFFYAFAEGSAAACSFLWALKKRMDEEEVLDKLPVGFEGSQCLRAAVSVGEPTSQRDPVTGRTRYSGPVVDEAVTLFEHAEPGVCMASDEARREMGSWTAPEASHAIQWTTVPGSVADEPKGDSTADAPPRRLNGRPRLASIGLAAVVGSNGAPPGKSPLLVQWSDLRLSDFKRTGALGECRRGELGDQRVVVRTLSGRISEEARLVFLEEACRWRGIRHQCVTGLVAATMSPHALVFEDGGTSVRDLVVGGQLKVSCRDVVAGTLNGLAYVAREQQQSHGALSAHKVFVDESGQVRVGGFGFRQLRLAVHTTATVSSGDMAYTAPEMLAGHSEGSAEKRDVYAVAVLAYEILTGTPPWSKSPVSPQAAAAGAQPWDADDNVDDFVVRCGAVNPEQRPLLVEALVMTSEV